MYLVFCVLFRLSNISLGGGGGEKRFKKSMLEYFVNYRKQVGGLGSFSSFWEGSQ